MSATDQDEIAKDQDKISKDHDETSKDQEEMSKVKEEMSTKDKDAALTKSEDVIPTKDKQKTKVKASKKGKGKVIHSKERGIIRNVLRFFDQEANINALLYPLKKAQQRAAVATGVSPRTIVRIRKEAQANPPESRLKTPGKHRRKRKATQEDEDSSKKLKSEKPDSSDTSSEEDENSGADLSTDSADPMSDPESEDPPFVNPKWPPTGEYVIKELRAVDINFFVRCLRKANSHHGTLPCNLNDMFMYEEASKNGILGIIFRCRVCLMSIIVWTQDPTKAPVLQLQAHGHMVAQRKSKVNSSPTPMDLISPKMRNLPKFLGAKPSVQSNPPLIGWPKVATQSSALRGSGLNPPLKGVPPASMKATVAELTFCVDQSESSPKPGSASVESSDHSISSTTMPKRIDTPNRNSLKAKYLPPWKRNAPAKPVPKKNITSAVVSQRPLKPRTTQPIGVSVSSLHQSKSIMTSSMQPKLIQSNATVTSNSQPRLNLPSGIMAAIQPRLNQPSGIMPSILQPELNQSSGIMPSTLQPRLFQASGMMSSPLQPRILQSSGVRTSSTGNVNSPRIFIIQRSLRPQSFQSIGPETSSTTMVKPGQVIQTAQIPLQPRFVPSSGPGTSSTAMANPEQIVLTPGAYAQGPLQPRIVQSSSLRISPTAMLKPERIIIGQDVFVQRPMLPRIVGSTPDKILILNDMFGQRPLPPDSAQPSDPRPTRTIKPEEITITPDVFPRRISLSGNAPSRGIRATSTSVAPETIISDVSTQDDTRRSSSETLPVDLNLVKMEVEESESCGTL